MYVNEDKILIEKVEVAGLQTAIRGMRNPMDSWARSDSFWISSNGDVYTAFDEEPEGDFVIGEDDKLLAQRLIKGGSEHCKFLRQIYVGFDIVLPRYVWSEFDTYHHNTKNSCSTMHKLFRRDKPITTDLFVYNEGEGHVIQAIVYELNLLREGYYLSEDNEIRNELLRRAKQLLPEGFLQRRTVSTNYAELRNIYHQRKNHRLPEWQVVCRFIESLPYAKFFLTNEATEI